MQKKLFRKVNILMNQKIYIILVNYNGFEDTIECLKSLKNLIYDNYQVIVVDNDSIDNSISKISKAIVDKKIIIYNENEALKGGSQEKENLFLNPIVLIEAKENNGFAAGNNIALQYILAKNDFGYIWLLNNDTVVDKNALTELVAGISHYKNVGAVGSKILYYDNRKLLQNVGSKIDENTFFKLCKPILDLGKDNIDNGQFDYDFEVNDIMGASLLVKKEVLSKVGLMPEEYFLYGEETDWNFNMQKYGFKLMTIYKSRVYHKKSRTTGGDLSPITLYYRTRNQFILNRKYMGSYKYLLFSVLFFFKKMLFLMKLDNKSKRIVVGALFDGLIGKKFKLNIQDTRN
jgi:GT2 family glycosyltransferase